MSSGANNNTHSWPSSQFGHHYGGYGPYSSIDSNHVEPVFRHSFTIPGTADAQRSSRDPWQMPEERVMGRPLSFAGFPDRPRTSNPVQIVWVENVPVPESTRTLNPRFSRPLPRLTIQQYGPVQREESRSSPQDEQNNVLSKLKREIYNPIPKTRRLSMCYRDQNRSSHSYGNEKEKSDEDGKRCAICLEDFEPREQVMLTPCDHMFHEECILPWVKSHDQCPVCRFVLSERIRQTAASVDNNNASNIAATDLITGELISIIRAMEEAFLGGSSR